MPTVVIPYLDEHSYYWNGGGGNVEEIVTVIFRWTNQQGVGEGLFKIIKSSLGMFIPLEGDDSNAALGHDKPKEVPSSDTEYALEGVQADVVLTTPLEDDS